MKRWGLSCSPLCWLLRPPATWLQNLLSLLLCLWLTSLRLPNVIPSGLRGVLHGKRGVQRQGVGVVTEGRQARLLSPDLALEDPTEGNFEPTPTPAPLRPKERGLGAGWLMGRDWTHSQGVPAWLCQSTGHTCNCSAAADPRLTPLWSLETFPRPPDASPVLEGSRRYRTEAHGVQMAAESGWPPGPGPFPRGSQLVS